jgi:hypothetical protein
MTMTHDEMIEVIQAHKDGKEIEAKNKLFDSAMWVTINVSDFDFFSYEYRVKPPQIEAWGVHYCGCFHIFLNEGRAREFIKHTDLKLIRLIPDPNWKE